MATVKCATVPAILTVVGTAAYVALPYIKEFLASFDPGEATGFKDSLDELRATIEGRMSHGHRRDQPDRDD